MKECPNCHELVGDTVRTCFKCHYDFLLKKVPSHDEFIQKRDREILKAQKEQERQKEFEIRKQEQLTKNPNFEYDIVIINDLPTGEINSNELKDSIYKHAKDGWRLAFTFTNEIGKSSVGVSIGNIGSMTNATIDSTVLIFERCVKA